MRKATVYHVDIDRVHTIDCDYLVVGAGVAGLRAAIELAESGSVLVVAKDSLRESSSEYAQGGIAAALSDDDEVELHEQDTMIAGAGLCDREAVRILVQEGPAAIQKLIEWGVEFDREGTKLLFALEGAHSRSRVLHSHGDSTGREIARTLYHKAASLTNIEFRSFASITDLLVHEGAVTGAVACDREQRRQVRIFARAVLLATGGLGRVFKETTNPDVATGDGVATAYRAGAVISDIEFVQFHPTALYVPNAPRFLLTEALRGEGGRLLNASGEPFMSRYDERGELAPRDIVSRSIVAEMRRTNSHVNLDLTHMDPAFVRRRFPRVYETCLQHGIDITAGPVPVHPAAHYAMGGVRTDTEGRTSMPRLFAAGEAACSGVHGANRLASNSLLEGLVFGARAGKVMRGSAAARTDEGTIPISEVYPKMNESRVRQIAWEYCGIARDATGLHQAKKLLESAEYETVARAAREHYELRNIHAVALLIARCALAREESRGGHFRTDFPETRPEFQKHSHVDRASEVSFA
jgi:L-aspartate oxidase